MIGFIIGLIIIGLIAGFIARALVPGDDSMSIVATIVLGIIGSFVGGLLADVLFRGDGEDAGLSPAGIIGSIIGAIIVLLIYNAVTGRRRHSVRH
jgi:uncharacterized membrane protein YeaQ/YmgE (transglycosylase-associated protein family)